MIVHSSHKKEAKFTALLRRAHEFHALPYALKYSPQSIYARYTSWQSDLSTSLSSRETLQILAHHYSQNNGNKMENTKKVIFH